MFRSPRSREAEGPGGQVGKVNGRLDVEVPPTTGATRSHECRRESREQAWRKRREALEVRRRELPQHRGDFQTTTQTFLMLEKPSQQAPSRFQIPKHVGGANAGEKRTYRGRDAHTGLESS